MHLTTLFNQRSNISFLLSKRMSDKSKWLFEDRFCKDPTTKQPLPHDRLPVCFEMRFVPQGRVLEALTWLLANSDHGRFAGWYCKNPTPPKPGGRPGRDHTQNVFLWFDPVGFDHSKAFTGSLDVPLLHMQNSISPPSDGVWPLPPVLYDSAMHNKQGYDVEVNYSGHGDYFGDKATVWLHTPHSWEKATTIKGNIVKALHLHQDEPGCVGLTDAGVVHRVVDGALVFGVSFLPEPKNLKAHSFSTWVNSDAKPMWLAHQEEHCTWSATEHQGKAVALSKVSKLAQEKSIMMEDKRARSLFVSSSAIGGLPDQISASDFTSALHVSLKLGNSAGIVTSVKMARNLDGRLKRSGHPDTPGQPYFFVEFATVAIMEQVLALQSISVFGVPFSFRPRVWLLGSNRGPSDDKSGSAASNGTNGTKRSAADMFPGRSPFNPWSRMPGAPPGDLPCDAATATRSLRSATRRTGRSCRWATSPPASTTPRSPTCSESR